MHDITRDGTSCTKAKATDGRMDKLGRPGANEGVEPEGEGGKVESPGQHKANEAFRLIALTGGTPGGTRSMGRGEQSQSCEEPPPPPAQGLTVFPNPEPANLPNLPCFLAASSCCCC